MYDACDVLNASYCSADVINHALREYGDGNMGAGIRRLAGEMLTIGGKKSYTLGYREGISATYPVAFKDGALLGSVISVCAIGVAGLSVWCVQKLIERHSAKKNDEPILTDTIEEVSPNA